MLDVLKQIITVGIVSEPAPAADGRAREREELHAELRRVLGRALCIRQVDAGSCNGCELEIHALNNPYYNIEGSGLKFVASPRHADMLLVTGPVSRHMEEALRRTYDATPDPKLVVAVGDWRLRRRLRRELCQPRPRRERDSGRRRGARLPADAHRHPGRHPQRGACLRVGAGHARDRAFGDRTCSRAWPAPTGMTIAPRARSGTRSRAASAARARPRAAAVRAAGARA